LSRFRRLRRAPARPRPDEFLDLAHRAAFGVPADAGALRRYGAALGETGNRLDVFEAMLRTPGHRRWMASRLLPDAAGLQDDEFVTHVYRTLLGREPDRAGSEHYRAALAAGGDRAAMVAEITASDEYVTRALATRYPLADLRARRPDRFGEALDVAGNPKPVFTAGSDADFDWLETAILDGGYYDRPGVWRFELNTDKLVMAEIVAALGRDRALELGCSTGLVLQCLARSGVTADGVEISGAAIEAADPAIRPRIHQVNATAIELPARYGVVFGLDIFEHLNPNALDGGLARVAAHLEPGGFVFANIPAFGEDPVFGTVFQLYLEPWLADADRGVNFRTLHTDDLGYPHNGHLTWARSDWWVARFEAAGLRRQPGIERALHARYDGYFLRETPARRSFYVFAKDADPAECRRIEESIAATPSAVLSGP